MVTRVHDVRQARYTIPMREVFNGLTCKMRIYRMQRHDDWVDCSIAMVDVMVDAMVNAKIEAMVDAMVEAMFNAKADVLVDALVDVMVEALMQ